MSSRPAAVAVPAAARSGGVRIRPAALVALTLTSLVGLASFTWPFFADASFARERGQDAPWLFAALLGLLAVVLLAEVTARGLDAKTVAVLGVLAAVGGALRVLSAGTAGLEPVFIVLVLGGRVLGRSMALLLGALALLAGAFLTAGIGPWLPFQMMAAGWVGLGAACLPTMRGRAELVLLALYGAATGLLYGAIMNLWFWPFLAATSAPSGAGFVPGAPVGENLAHYAVFYVATSLGWDLPRAVVTATVILLAGRPVLRALRRAVRKAAFDGPSPEFESTLRAFGRR